MEKSVKIYLLNTKIKIYINILLFLFACASIISCENLRKNTERYYFKGVPIEGNKTIKEISASKKNVVKLELAKFKGKELVFTDILEGVELIPLETNEDYLIGEIDKIQIYNGFYFILDKRSAKSLFVFDENGKFKYSIKSQGKGPLEFIRPYDFTIDFDSNQLIIFDGKLSKLVFYEIGSGKPLKEKRLYYRFHNIAYSGKGVFCFSSHGDDNSHLSSIDKYLLYMTDSTFKLKNKFLLEKRNSNNNYYLRNDLTQISGVNYAPRFKNKVFKIKDSIIYELYDISFDDIEVNETAYDLEFSKFREKTENGFYFMGTYVEGNKVDFFELKSARKTISIFRDKTNGMLAGGDILTFDPLKLPFYSDPVTSDNDEFISYLEAHSLSHIKESIKESELKELPELFYSLIQKTSDDDNPIIIRYKINLNMEEAETNK